jgi:hypothetical protein
VTWRDTILSLRSPIAQRYCFAHYVLGEPRMDAAAIAGAFQNERMDATEYDSIVARWNRQP